MAEVVRVRVYVDHLNFFWRVQRHYDTYWVDLEKLILQKIQKKIPGAVIERITLYSAMFKDEDLEKKQKLHFKAMQLNSKTLRIDLGYHSEGVKTRNLVKFGKVTRKEVKVHHVEEKQSDGNIVAQIIHEAHTESDQFDVAVLVSNDTDLARALKIKQELNQRVILISPIPEDSRTRVPKVPYELRRYVASDDRIVGFNKRELLDCYLPNRVGIFENPGDETWFPKKITFIGKITKFIFSIPTRVKSFLKSFHFHK